MGNFGIPELLICAGAFAIVVVILLIIVIVLLARKGRA